MIDMYIICAERMLSHLDPLGTLQHKRFFFYLVIVIIYKLVICRCTQAHAVIVSLVTNTNSHILVEEVEEE